MAGWLLYIDPGSGSYIIQAIVAAALGAAFFVKTSWWRIKMFFRRKKNGKTDQET